MVECSAAVYRTVPEEVGSPTDPIRVVEMGDTNKLKDEPPRNEVIAQFSTVFSARSRCVSRRYSDDTIRRV
jgi:hypothetical protein